jgi:hypothetical protein
MKEINALNRKKSKQKVLNMFASVIKWEHIKLGKKTEAVKK